MHRTVLALLLCSCAPLGGGRNDTPTAVVTPAGRWADQNPSRYVRQYGESEAERDARVVREYLAASTGRSVPNAVTLPPSAARENALLEDALAARPDYTAALRRAAEANIAEEVPTRRESAPSRQARIAAEEARLSDVIEGRRRERLAQRGQQERNAQLRQAASNCEAQGALAEASYFPRGFLGMEAMAVGVRVRDECMRRLP